MSKTKDFANHLKELNIDNMFENDFFLPGIKPMMRLRLFLR